MGDEARKFVESDLGKCLVGMARQEVTAAQEELLSADPTDTKAITKLQNKAAMGRMFEQWLCELITRGENALAMWQQENKAS